MISNYTTKQNATLIVKVLEHIKSELEKEGMFKPYKNIFYNAYKGHLKYESKQCSNIWQKIKLYCAINLHDLYRMYGRDFIRNLFKIERTYNRTKISFLGIKLKVKKGLFKKICKIERNHNRIKINFLGVKLKIRENLFDKVKFTMRYKGREMSANDMGKEILNKLIEDLEGLCKVDAAPKAEGKQVYMIVSPA